MLRAKENVIKILYINVHSIGNEGHKKGFVGGHSLDPHRIRAYVRHTAIYHEALPLLGSTLVSPV